MASTPIYSWPTPDNTDLVKNGALAIRTLGDSIDTTMGTMTPKSIVDAKGDLIAASANDTPARLAVGNNGEALVADSSTTTGLRYATNFGWTAGKNKIINGDFGIWQRGTSFNITVQNTYTADRFMASYSTTAPTTYTVSQQSFSAGEALNAQVNPTFYLRSALTSIGSATSARIVQRIEDVRTFADNTIVVSFWARADAARTLTVQPTRNFGSGGSTVDFPASSQTVSLTTDWQRYSLIFVLASLTGKTIGAGSNLEFRFQHPDENSTIDFFGIQVERGFVATNFQTATGTIQGELAACQRYYYRIATDTVNTRFGVGHNLTTTVATCLTTFPVTMRIRPTALEQSGTVTDYRVNHANTGTVCSAVPAFVIANQTSAQTNLTVASGLTAGQGCNGGFATTDGFLGWSVEL